MDPHPSPGLPSAGADDKTLHLPRLLCLHGGGTNARIFQAQCRVLRAHLAPHLRLVFADAPYLWARPGPDVLSVYADWGPFRGWLGPQPAADDDDGARPTHDEVIGAVDESLARAVREDDGRGATGPVVGVLGFSQGGKLAASLLMREQLRRETGQGWEGGGYRFAVVMAGRAPVVLMTPGLGSAGPAHPLGGVPYEGGRLLRLPTIHVHGLADPGLEMHRELLHEWCEEGTTRLVEWDGDHRLPFKAKDVSPLAAEIVKVGREVGVLRR
ncbi:hypothetical protein P8C59_002846 [Phyllachora maydis]|uniref:Serine hydrolase domain-containing protein n=1 Tax=Phyllachora maydis TaxID=1825666 RepID=A0AAD9M8G5_9PEZI|nr:hypothetical protein P8C59_002846 [Phyllachora maydis]